MSSSYYVDTVDTSYGISNTTGLLSVFAGLGIFMWIVTMAISILMIVSMWKMFTKAGKPGWAAIIPIYNIYVMCEIAGKEWWYILLLCVPIANIYAMFVIYGGIAKKFGKTTGFTIGMMFFPFIFFTILGLGKNSIYLDGMEFSNDTNSVNEINEEISQEGLESGLSDSYVSEVQPVSQINTGYVAPTFDMPVGQTTSMSGESAPMMSEPVTPVAEPTPIMSEPVATVVEPAPMMSEPVTPAVEPTPMMSEPVAPVAEPAPMMSEPVTPVTEPTPMMSEPVTPVAEAAPMMSEPSAPVSPQQEVNQVTDGYTSLWSNNNNNNGQM